MNSDISDTINKLGDLYEDDKGLYQALDEYHADVGNALLDSIDNGDMVSVVELEEETDLSPGPISEVVDALYQIGRIEREEEMDTRFYDLNSYTLGDWNTVQKALDMFDVEMV